MNEHACRLVSIQVERSGQTHSLTTGEKVHLNELFAVTVQLDEWRYFYIARISLQGIRILFPADGNPPLQGPGVAIRIPAAEAWLRCKDLNENEKLCLIVAKRRLDGDTEYGASRDGDKTSNDDKKNDPNDPEKNETNRTGFEQLIEIPVQRHHS